jgi:heme exporter protein B
METRSSGSVKRSLSVFFKDIKSELRTRYAINAILMFAIVTVFAVSWAVGGTGLNPALQASFLWIVIYFSSLSGLSQCFVKEEESKTAIALRLYSPAEVVLGGKLLFNLVMLFLLNLITIPLFAIFIGFDISNLALFLTILIAGSIGLVAVTTIVAAIISKASAKGALFAVLSFPLVLPLLVEAISGTKKAMTTGIEFGAARIELQVLISYIIVISVLGFLLFEAIWND